MRVAIVSDYLPGYHSVWSGAELVAVALAEMIGRNGCEPFFLTTPFESHGSGQYDAYPLGTPMKRLGTISRNFPVDIGAIAGMCMALRVRRPDVVHVNAKYLFLPAVISCMLMGLPAVFTVPDYFIFCPTTFIRRPDGSTCESYHGASCYSCLEVLSKGVLKKAAYTAPSFLARGLLALRAAEFDYFIKKVSAYIALTDFSKRRLVNYGIPEEKVRVIYHYTVQHPGATDEPIESPSVIFAGWLSDENGTDVLVRAFARVLKKVKGARLYLIGDGKGSYIDELKCLSSSLGTSESVIFLGRRSNRETLSIVSKADAVVVPHQWPKEFGPVILVEALALGKPVVASRAGATEEFIENGVSGFLVDDYRSPDRFSERIVEILSDSIKAADMGKRGMQWARCFLSEKRAAGEMIGLYEGLLKNRCA